MQKYLARAGVGSRRACEVLVKNGEVLVNGSVAKIGMTVSDKDVVEFEEKVVQVMFFSQNCKCILQFAWNSHISFNF